jgi:Helix-turn-helix domain
LVNGQNCINNKLEGNEGLKTMARKEDWIVRIPRSLLENRSLSCGARVVYGILLGYHGENCKEPFPKLDTLAWHVRCCRSVVQKYVRELQKAGLLKIKKRTYKGKFSSNGYELLPATVSNSSAVENQRSEENRSRESLLLSKPNTKETHIDISKEAHVKEAPHQIKNELQDGPLKWWHTYDHPLTEEDALKKYGVWNDILRTHVIPRSH